MSVSAGSVFNFNLEAYEHREEAEQIIQQQLIASSLAHADETGINVDGQRIWLHSVSNAQWTYFHPHAKRGTEAMVVGPAISTAPRVMSKKRATSATYSLPLLPSQGSLPFSPCWPRWPMAHMARTSATLLLLVHAVPTDDLSRGWRFIKD